jgi:PKD repeat protein
VQHTFTKPGAYTVTLTVTDSAHQVVIKTTHLTVGKHAHVRLRGPHSLHRHTKGSFSTKGSTTPNTGAKIVKVFWKWGDGRSSKGTGAHHAYAKAGKYKITVTLSDNTGVKTTVHRHVTVKT